jgi:hypothetical protein
MSEAKKPEACEFCKSDVYMSGVVQGVECIEFKCGTEWGADNGFEQSEECRVSVLQQLLAEAHEAFQNIAIAANDIGDLTNADYASVWVSRLSEFEKHYPTP